MLVALDSRPVLWLCGFLWFYCFAGADTHISGRCAFLPDARLLCFRFSCHHRVYRIFVRCSDLKCFLFGLTHSAESLSRNDVHTLARRMHLLFLAMTCLNFRRISISFVLAVSAALTLG